MTQQNINNFNAPTAPLFSSYFFTLAYTIWLSLLHVHLERFYFTTTESVN